MLQTVAHSSSPVAGRPNAPAATIRRARPDDLDALETLEEATFDGDRISRRSFRALLASKSALVLVCEAPGGGPLFAYATLLFRTGTALARLYSIAVSRESSGQGIGRALLMRIEHEAYERERIAVRLEVRADNAPAIALYKGAGYRFIGTYQDYYADGAEALRFEKTLHGDHPAEGTVPFYAQTTDFTCGPSCLMMAMAKEMPNLSLDPVLEIRLWRESTTIFMMSGPGGCEPFGLAVAAHEFGLSAEIHVSAPGTLFLDGVRSAQKQGVMALAQEDFRRRAEGYGIPVVSKAFTLRDLKSAIAAGKTAIVLISGYQMFGKKVPHWVLAHGDDGRHIVIHDPWIAEERGESRADAANLPIPYATFDRIARFGKVGLRAAVFLGRR
ncbi:MAG: GNAT family N-acetyltransferase/peptidase C39 family protein [Rhizobiaceae bacterium]|nr:GNAT family N-acetyltransferase/peptidase C39 family protein [Rhizobiaceae bacterium]